MLTAALLGHDMMTFVKDEHVGAREGDEAVVEHVEENLRCHHKDLQ